jgi:Spy/CpxP family protein refolding chaperone
MKCEVKSWKLLSPGFQLHTSVFRVTPQKESPSYTVRRRKAGAGLKRGDKTDMNGRRYFMMGCLALILLSVASLPAAAQGYTGATARRARFARLLSAKQFAAGLNLTADQKAQIKTILANNKTQILQAARNVVKARLDVANGVPNAADQLAAARLQAVNLRKSIFDQMKSILTPDQLAQAQTKMQNRQQLRAQRLQKLLDRINSKIGA